MSLIPSDVDIGGVYYPPLLLAFIIAVIAMVLTGYLLNRYRLSRFFMFPMLTGAAIVTIYTVLISTFLLPG